MIFSLAKHSLIYALLFSISAVHAEPQADVKDLPRIPATEPEDAIETFEIRPGFELQLAAHEPEVVDPIAMCFDEDGRMFVVEMRGYSERRDDELGRIRMLEDTDGDGVYEKATVYLDKLKWPTAVLCYQGGIFVGATPDIFYAKDTDGDGVADEKKTVFTGFGKGKEMRLNMQALFNSFRWGPDNRIWGATAANGGSITRPDDSSFAEVSLRGADFSFDPELLDLRPENGTAQYGMSFDSQGRRYICSNSRHLIWVAWERSQLKPNPWFRMPPALTGIATDGSAAPVFRISDDEPWRVVRTRWRVSGVVKGIVEGGGRVSGYFTSATGINLFWGDAFGEGFRDNVFVGDVGSNLLHRKILSRSNGKSQPIAKRPADEQETEFLRSSDNWFRPASTHNGPDGCLYVCDMYREVIEHPWSLPEGIKKHLDLNSGNDRGRIYRIQPEGHQRRSIPRLSEASDEDLQDLINHPNDWHQTTARRLLYERGVAAEVKQAPDQFTADLSAESPLLENLERAQGDTWAEAALLNSLRNMESLKEAWTRIDKGSSPSFRSSLLAMIGRSGNLELMESILAELSEQPVRAETAAVISGLQSGSGTSPSWKKLSASSSFMKLQARARNTAQSPEASTADKQAALSILSGDNSEKTTQLLRKIVADHSVESGLRLSAARSLTDTDFLIQNYASLPGLAKTEVANRAVSRADNAKAFLLAIQSGKIKIESVAADALEKLRNHSDVETKNLAASVLPKIASRSAAVADYQATLKLTGDARNGETKFAALCIGCHKTPDGKGWELGPDIQTYRTAGPESILTNILDPNKEVAPQYQAFTFQIGEEILTGIIGSEDSTQITVKMPGGLEKTFPRKKVTSMKGLGTSLMPEGLEAALSKQDIADLIAYIQGE